MHNVYVTEFPRRWNNRANSFVRLFKDKFLTSRLFFNIKILYQKLARKFQTFGAPIPTARKFRNKRDPANMGQCWHRAWTGFSWVNLTRADRPGWSIPGRSTDLFSLSFAVFSIFHCAFSLKAQWKMRTADSAVRNSESLLLSGLLRLLSKRNCP